jgi:hypothetical protein
MMVTMYKVKPMINDELQSFLEDTGCSRMQFEILRFMGKHPKARFSLYVIARAMGTGGTDLGNALIGLIEKDVLLTQVDDNGLTTYCLGADNETCRYIYRLADLDWSEAMALKKQLKEDEALRYLK